MMQKRATHIREQALSAFVLTPWCGDGHDWGELWYCPLCDKLASMMGEELEKRRHYSQWQAMVAAKKRAQEKKVRKALGQAIKKLVIEHPEAVTPPRTSECGFCGMPMLNAGEALGEMFLERDHPEAGPQRPLVGDYLSGSHRGMGYYEDVTGQYVHLAVQSPSPNLFLCKATEMGTADNPHKHDGQIDAIRADDRFLVVREFVENLPSRKEERRVRDANSVEVQLYLLRQGFDPFLVDMVLRRGVEPAILSLMLKGRERPAIHVPGGTMGLVALPKGVKARESVPVTGPRNVITWRNTADMMAGGMRR